MLRDVEGLGFRPYAFRAFAGQSGARGDAGGGGGFRAQGLVLQGLGLRRQLRSQRPGASFIFFQVLGF